VNRFEIIDPDTLDMQGLLDPSDESLDFVRRRSDNTRPKPVAIYRIENEFLLSMLVRVMFRKSKTELTSIRQSLRFTLTVVGEGHGRTSWCTGKERQRASVSCTYIRSRDPSHAPHHSIPIPTRIRARIRRDL
jgi:hypothetical protein